MISKRLFILGMLIGAVLLAATVFSLPDGKLHLVFCDVGQGDAAFIRTPNGRKMLIDGGPDGKVLSCIGRRMPFYDRTVDVAVVTHPQKDHMMGIYYLLERYDVKYIVMGIEGSKEPEYRQLQDLIRRKKIPVKNLFRGDSFTLDNTSLTVFWPEKKWVEVRTRKNSREAGGRDSEYGLDTEEDLNLFSYYLLLKHRNFSALFTGDGDSNIQPDVLRGGGIPTADILKVPHHGSKIALLPEFLDTIRPKMAVISVGKNSFGHPAAETVRMLQNAGVVVRRTDQEGDIELLIDSRSLMR